MDVQTLRMLVWWIAGGKCPEMMKIVEILGIPRILLILSIYWLYYPQRYTPQEQQRRRKFQSQETQHTNEQICLSSRITGVIASLSLLSTRWKWDKTATSDETFLCPDPDSQFANHQLSVFNVTDLISWWVNFIALCIGVSSTGALAIIMWEERLVWLGANTARPPAVLTPT